MSAAKKVDVGSAWRVLSPKGHSFFPDELITSENEAWQKLFDHFEDRPNMDLSNYSVEEFDLTPCPHCGAWFEWMKDFRVCSDCYV